MSQKFKIGDEGFLAALPKPEPVAYLRFCAGRYYCGHGDIEYGEGLEVTPNKMPGDDGSEAFPVYTEAPQDTAAIEQRVAEACAKVCLDRAKIEKSKAVSSRYSGAIAMAQMYDQNSEQAELLSKEIVEQWREFL